MPTKTVHIFDDAGLNTGPMELDAGYLVPFTENVWSLPRNCVEFAPPPTGEHEIAQINQQRTAWVVIPYWIGHVYWLADRTRHEIKDAGVEPPADALAEDPGPSLDQAKAARVAVIAYACEAAIVAGFESTALGEPCTYPCKLTDQANLMASVSASREPGLPPTWRAPFWCQDAQGQWQYRLHTAEQIRHVGMDGYAATLTKLQRKAALEADIQAATTNPAVDAIAW